ncbi:class I SAM-dependent methyltransferase [Desulfovibrio sp. ZJ200]|uniref:class I SAM-dependent methyltransferase n=1 Tax=Desulfovibrio sp. ZJ200 TaxID=2709792 RepID=UPI0013EA7B8B|nr:class I SAM-dependent methyltransferase [Desulfovibrio sp. ZJ200]
MKTEWDYTQLADAYLKRPDYAPSALQELFQIAGLQPGDNVCDIGAGVAHLTLPLAAFGCRVDAVEPNDAMRANGQRRTAHLPAVFWSEGTGEATGRPSGLYDFVTFGSSFNACDRSKALSETHRLLKPGKYFACLWNHRDLDDPIQKRIEEIIKMSIPSYSYGTRREDQTEVIAASGLFDAARQVEGRILWEQDIADTVQAWRSHATLHRQAGDHFGAIIENISDYLNSLGRESITIPYTTRAWIARRKE